MSNAVTEQDPAEAYRHPAFVPIPLSTVGASLSLPVDLYLKQGENQPPILYRESELPISTGDIERLVERGIRVAYIRAEQVASYQLYLRDNLETFLLKEEIPALRRYEFLSETARDLLNASFDHGNTDVLVQSTAEVGDRMKEVSHYCATATIFLAGN